ncbi:MAG TPA: ketopantoate reductase family protein [Clostridiales bacterium]|jgi:2-dehydropantoate 2-reductase|nr:ketopantoate reductase family protein [Clostridiales bacterium]
MKIEKITIVGMGALGVMYGDFLARKLGKEHVEFVANKKRIDKYNKEGVFCNGRKCDFTVVDEEEQGAPADLLIFAVKATGLEEAIQTVRNKVSDNTIIMSVLNGISSEDIIGRVYGMDKIIHCIVQAMDTTKIENQVKYSQFGHICLGIDEENEDKKRRLRAVLDLFDKVGMPYILEDDIMRRIWGKFMLNVGLNQSVMIYEGTYATVQKPGKARELMKNAMREVMRLAQMENINLTQKDFDDYIELVDQMNPNGMPSMRQDGLQKRKSEVELFAGTVIKLADKHKIDVPVNKKIYETILKIEGEY